MGERLSGDRVPGRQHVHPGDASSDPWDERDTAGLEATLDVVIRDRDLDPEAEQRALVAFRTTRNPGTHRARTRRRDDWRLPAKRRAGRPVKTTFGVVFASLALGGVAVAAIGSAGSSTDGAGTGRATEHPSVAPERPGSAASSAPTGTDRPTNGSSPAQNTEAHCRAYEQVKDRGKALEATAWQQLVAAAGGSDKVAVYCSEQLAQATSTPSKSVGTGKPSQAADAGNGTAGNTGSSGNGQTGGAKGKGKKPK
ncbi:hypothetical protein [Streptomyces hokutonensis]|uniref:hypothetical protein n=1 Tax=Streptomyces hokutonensis TaxID=1306990 RepID=UPI00380F4FB8